MSVFSVFLKKKKKRKRKKLYSATLDFSGGSVVKNPPAIAGDMGSIPGSGRSPGVGNGNPLQYSCLRNPIDRGASWATVHRVAKSRTQLSKRTTATLAAYCPSEALASLVKYLFSFPLFFPPSLFLFLSIFSISRMKFLFKELISLCILVFYFAYRTKPLIDFKCRNTVVWSMVNPCDHLFKKIMFGC